MGLIEEAKQAELQQRRQDQLLLLALTFALPALAATGAAFSPVRRHRAPASRHRSPLRLV